MRNSIIKKIYSSVSLATMFSLNLSIINVAR